jgi:peptidoglycan/LPS O-acetylase OafA/YrhL
MIKSKRIYGLDILRAWAILLVVSLHGMNYITKSNLINKISGFVHIDGVTIFFVLSGFLIGGILIKTIDSSQFSIKGLFNFWIRRWFRTLPAYYFSLFLMLFILPIIFNGYREVDLLFKTKYVLFIQNFASPHPDFYPEAWSLSIEEWFYLVVPILIFIITRILNAKKSIATVAIFLIVAVTLYRYFKFSHNPIDNYYDLHFQYLKQVVTRLDSLMYGVIGAFTSFYYASIWLKYKKVLFWIGLFMLYSLKIWGSLYGGITVNMYMAVFQTSVSSIGALFLIPMLSSIKTGSGIIFKIITFLSLISYSMYLINLSIVQKYFINRIGFENQVMNYFAFWIITILLSYFMYNWIELPFMKIREKMKLK